MRGADSIHVLCITLLLEWSVVFLIFFETLMSMWGQLLQNITILCCWVYLCTNFMIEHVDPICNKYYMLLLNVQHTYFSLIYKTTNKARSISRLNTTSWLVKYWSHVNSSSYDLDRQLIAFLKQHRFSKQLQGFIPVDFRLSETECSIPTR